MKYTMHIQQFSPECELVLFRNDLPGTNPQKSTQQKSLEEHMRMRKGQNSKIGPRKR